MREMYSITTNVRPTSEPVQAKLWLHTTKSIILTYTFRPQGKEAKLTRQILHIEIGHEKAQSVIDSITNSYAAAGESGSNPMLAPQGGPPIGGPGFAPPPFGFPGKWPRLEPTIPPLLASPQPHPSTSPA